MLTHEQMLRLRLEVGAAAGLPCPAKVMVMSRPWEQEQLPGPADTTAEHRLMLLRAEYARMINAARASVTAWRAGAADPLAYMEAELARHDGLPPRDTTVPAVLADAATAMILVGRAARLPGTVKAA